MLKRPRLQASTPQVGVSQTFPEGKGVETKWLLNYTLLPNLTSQTFPEGKGVETSTLWRKSLSGTGRRPSQKVKVLKLAIFQATQDAGTSARSQTFPEGKGVETYNQPRANRSLFAVADLPRR